MYLHGSHVQCQVYAVLALDVIHDEVEAVAILPLRRETSRRTPEVEGSLSTFANLLGTMKRFLLMLG